MMRKWMIGVLTVMVLCGQAHAALRDGIGFPQNAFARTLPELVNTYGAPDATHGDTYVWTNRDGTILWSFTYPDRNGYPTQVGHGTRFAAHQDSVRGFLAACELVYNQVGVKGQTMERSDGNPSVKYRIRSGGATLVTLFRDTHMVAINTFAEE